MFIATVMVVVLAMTLSPQSASATKACKTYDYSNVTESEWQCVKNYTRSKGYPLEKDSGSKPLPAGLNVKYNYDKEGKKLDLKIETPTLLCWLIQSKAESYVNEAMQQCR